MKKENCMYTVSASTAHVTLYKLRFKKNNFMSFGAFTCFKLLEWALLDTFYIKWIIHEFANSKMYKLKNLTIICKEKTWSPSRAKGSHMVAVISVSLAFSQTPVYTVRCGDSTSRSVPVDAPAFAGTHCTYPRRDGQAELTWMAGCIPGWFTRLQTVTHPSTNRARRWLTSLMQPYHIVSYRIIC